MDLMDREKLPSCVPKKLYEDGSVLRRLAESHCYYSSTYLRIITLKRLTLFRLIGFASSWGLPRYVALKLAQGMKTVLS